MELAASLWLVAPEILLGTAALVWMVQRIGSAAIGTAIVSIGWWAVPLMASSVATLLLNTAAIRVFMRPEQRMVSYGRVLLAQLSGQAVNSVTPTGTVGEVLKVTMLMGHAPRYRAASSIVAFNVSVILTNACLVLFAMAVSVVPPPGASESHKIAVMKGSGAGFQPSV